MSNYRSKMESTLDNLKDRVLGAIDEGKDVHFEVENRLASFVSASHVEYVPTGEQTWTITVPGVTDGEAIEIAELAAP